MIVETLVCFITKKLNFYLQRFVQYCKIATPDVRRDTQALINDMRRSTAGCNLVKMEARNDW